jgi:Zn finger protein HypA/HybF involved in hydrogenase expression
MENNKEVGIVRTKIPVQKIGGSYFLLLDKQTRNMLHVDHGTILGVKLWNIELQTIECPHCHHIFDDEKEADPHDCPACGEEFLNVNAIIPKTEIEHIGKELSAEIDNVINTQAIEEQEVKGGQI